MNRDNLSPITNFGFRGPRRWSFKKTVAVALSTILAAPMLPATRLSAWGTQGVRMSFVGVEASASASFSTVSAAAGNIWVAGLVTSTSSAGFRTDFDPGAATVNVIGTSSGYPYFAKYTSTGDFVFAKTLVVGSSSNANAIIGDSTGNAYLGGRFQGSVDLDPSAGTLNFSDTGMGDSFVAKYNSNGQIIWGTKLKGGATGSDAVNSIDIIGNDIVVTGNFGGDMDPDGVPASGDEITAGASGDNVFVSKLDGSTGAIQWFVTFGSDGTETGRVIKVDSSGNSYITGKFQNQADFDPSSSGQYLMMTGNNQPTGGCDDAYLLSLDSTGAFRWVNRFGSASCYDQGTSVALSNDGSKVFFGGYHTGTAVSKYGNLAGTTDTATVGNASTGNGFLVGASTSNGAFQWFRQVSSSVATAAETVSSIAVTSADRVVVSGYISAASTSATIGDYGSTFEITSGSSGGTYDPYIWEMSTSGVAGWVRTFGGTTSDFMTVVTPGPNAGIVGIGSFTGTADFDVESTGTVTATTTSSKAHPYILQVSSAGVSAMALPPTVSTVTPSSGATSGGTSITIDGANFVSGATVTVGGNACNVSATTSTSITCTTSAGSAGTVSIVVTNPDAQSATGTNLFSYVPAPTVASISPTSGPATGGTSVTITGTGFLAGAMVAIGGVSCTSVTVNSSTSVSCTTPSGTAGTADVVVTNTDSQTGTGVGIYTYNPGPSVSSVSPTSGRTSGGTAITITGTDFSVGSTVTVGGSSCTSAVRVSSTSLTCTTPSGTAGAVDIVVTNADSQTGIGAGIFTYRAAPTVTSITPTSGDVAGLQNVVIQGTGFYAGASVTIGTSTACTGVTVVNATRITCTTSAHSAVTGVTVRVTNADSQYGELTNAYSYVTTTTVAGATTTTTTSTTVPRSNTSLITSVAGAPTLVTSVNQSALEAAPGEAVAIINGRAVAVETVKVNENATPAAMLEAAKEIVAEITKLLPAGASNDIKVVKTDQGAELTGLMINPDDPKEKLNVPVESVTLVKAGSAAVLISALNQTNLPAEVVAGGEIQVTRGGLVAARAYGLPGAETGEIVLMSTPRLLQKFTVSASGTYNGQVPLPKNISFGSHTIVMATANAKVSLGIKLVRTRMQFRIKRVIATTIFKNRAGVKKAGGKITITGVGQCKASLTKVTMSRNPGRCFITVKQVAKGKYPAIYYRFTVQVVKKLIKPKKK